MKKKWKEAKKEIDKGGRSSSGLALIEHTIQNSQIHKYFVLAETSSQYCTINPTCEAA